MHPRVPYKKYFASNLSVKSLELFDIIIFEILLHIQGDRLCRSRSIVSGGFGELSL